MKWKIYQLHLSDSQVLINHYKSKAAQLTKLNVSSLSTHCFSPRKSLCPNFFLAQMKLLSIYSYLPYRFLLLQLCVRDLCHS